MGEAHTTHQPATPPNSLSLTTHTYTHTGMFINNAERPLVTARGQSDVKCGGGSIATRIPTASRSGAVAWRCSVVQRESLHEVSCRITHRHSPTHTHPLSCLPRTPTVCQEGAQEGERCDGATVLQGESGTTWHAWQPHRCCLHNTALFNLEIAHPRIQTQRELESALSDWNRANQALVPTIPN
jgi:hypothetical protein